MSDADRVKWNARWRERAEIAAPSPFLISLDGLLPRSGRALDVAGGAGRHAIFLAQRGLSVTLVDTSDVALALAREGALHAGVELTTLASDLERDPLPAGPWELVVCFHFLLRPLFAQFARVLAPSGLLVFVQPTRANLERHPRPNSTFLLEDGELLTLVKDQGLEVLHYQEGWLDEGRHDARLVARALNSTRLSTSS